MKNAIIFVMALCLSFSQLAAEDKISGEFREEGYGSMIASLKESSYSKPPRERRLKIISLKQSSSKTVVYHETPPSKDYSRIWHFAATSLAASSLYVTYKANREYENLYSDNEDIKDRYENERLKSAQRSLMEDEYENNKREMKAMRTRFLTAGSIAVIALIWEAYLIFKDRGRTKIALESNDLRCAVVPEPSGDIKLSLNWMF